MSKKIGALLVLAVAVICWLLFTKTKNLPPPVVEEDSPVTSISNALAETSPRITQIIESNFATVTATPQPVAAKIPMPAGTPNAPEFTVLPPEIVLENVRHAIQTYGSMFHGNPVGTNPEIAAALAGNNPKQANFINADTGVRMNEKGELVDAWGVPFFFHQLSGTQMEIHSAGPDKIMWTADDLMTR